MTETIEDLRQRIADLEAAARKRFDDCEQPVRNLSKSESRLWNRLEKAKGATVDRDTLLTAVYGESLDTPGDRAIDHHIKRIKVKHGDLGLRIKTVYSLGYRLVPT